MLIEKLIEGKLEKAEALLRECIGLADKAGIPLSVTMDYWFRDFGAGMSDFSKAYHEMEDE